MRAAEIVEGEIDLRAVDVDVRIVGEGQANAVVNSENELAVGYAILQAFRARQGTRELLPAAKAQRCFQWRSGLCV